jgi:acetyl esterase/lipase
MNGPDGTAHWPVVIILHIGGFKGGSFYQSLGNAPEDLANAGFYVVVADYPLAPPNSIKGQYAIQQRDPTRSGRYPQQTRAIEAVVDAAKNDPHCYHRLVGVLGGSAGASHAAYIALDVSFTNGLWPFWTDTARPKCVACLSGQYDFSDREMDVYEANDFIHNIENYTYTTNPLQQWMDSPIALVGNTALHGFIPMYCLRASDDPGSPKTNSDYLWYTMTQNGATSPNLLMWEVPDASMDHAFALWSDYTQDNPDFNFRVRDRVIAFFTQYLHD